MGVVVGELVQKRLLERFERRNSFLVPIEKTTQGRIVTPLSRYPRLTISSRQVWDRHVS
jgi:hypothetical protein